MQSFLFYFPFGWEHILSRDALDHQLFIAVLAAIYLWQDWKKVLVLVTAFTIGHSLTLTLSVLDILRMDSHWVEFLIPVTIVITSLSNIFWKDMNPSSVRLNYILALCFGFIHGMGFANNIRFMLSQEQQLGWSLLGFNLGLEAGQLIVVALILWISQLIVKQMKVERRHWILFLSTSVLIFSLLMCIERIPF